MPYIKEHDALHLSCMRTLAQASSLLLPMPPVGCVCSGFHTFCHMNTREIHTFVARFDLPPILTLESQFCFLFLGLQSGQDRSHSCNSTWSGTLQFHSTQPHMYHKSFTKTNITNRNACAPSLELPDTTVRPIIVHHVKHTAPRCCREQ